MTCNQTQLVFSQFASRGARKECLEGMIIVEADLAPKVRGILTPWQLKTNRKHLTRRHSMAKPF